MSQRDDIARLNALVDGELSPGEHAALAARLATDRDFAHAYATFTRLKACVVESAEAVPVADIALHARRSRRPILVAAIVGAAAAACLALLFGATTLIAPRQPTPVVLSANEAITLVALPEAPVIPDLAVAGLRLVGTTVEAAGPSRILVADYRGPRGCRLELHVRRADMAAPVAEGTARHSWVVGSLAYDLVAYGMPQARFAVVAEAAEQATRSRRMPEPASQRLREASVAAPPCVA
jgi:anti-sigma factor RsiW